MTPLVLTENNNGGKNPFEVEAQPSQDSAKHLPFDPVAEAPSLEHLNNLKLRYLNNF